MDIFEQLLEAKRKHLAVSLCMVIATNGSTPRHAGSKMLVYEDGHIAGTVGGGEVENRVIQEGLAAIKDGKTRRLSYSMTDPARGDVGVCGGQVEVYVEPVLPQPLLLVIGGGHVGKALAHLGHWLGFRVAVSDDRVELCTPEENPDADEFYPVDMAELPKHLKSDARTYVVLTTRGMVVDVPGLPALLDMPAAYIGVIGSRRRWTMTRKSLLEAGIPAEKLERVVAPIGLELHAETPEEIAVSIMAEIMMLRNGGTGQRMKV
ncbi:MAG TPA: XdhC family protein [Anaerolineaceae bacterium]|nr:XdhC family protein [Anaerolineaceae bacterium]HPN50575.1 XdhC family protein [Anaerolineaceae bacterium]